MTDARRDTIKVGSLVLLKSVSSNVWQKGQIQQIRPADLHKEACAVIVTRTDPFYLMRWKINNFDPLPQSKWKHHLRLDNPPETQSDPNDGAPVTANKYIPWKNYKNVQDQSNRLPCSTITWRTDGRGIPSALVIIGEENYTFGVSGTALKDHRKIVKAAHLFLNLVAKARDKQYLNKIGWPDGWKVNDMYRCANAALQGSSASKLNYGEGLVWKANKVNGEKYWAKNPNPEQNYKFLNKRWRLKYQKIQQLATKATNNNMSNATQKHHSVVLRALNSGSKSKNYTQTKSSSSSSSSSSFRKSIPIHVAKDDNLEDMIFNGDPQSADPASYRGLRPHLSILTNKSQFRETIKCLQIPIQEADAVVRLVYIMARNFIATDMKDKSTLFQVLGMGGAPSKKQKSMWFEDSIPALERFRKLPSSLKVLLWTVGSFTMTTDGQMVENITCGGDLDKCEKRATKLLSTLVHGRQQLQAKDMCDKGLTKVG